MFTENEKKIWKDVLTEGVIMDHKAFVMDNGKMNNQYEVFYNDEIYHITYWDDELIYVNHVIK